MRQTQGVLLWHADPKGGCAHLIGLMQQQPVYVCYGQVCICQRRLHHLHEGRSEQVAWTLLSHTNHLFPRARIPFFSLAHISGGLTSMS